VWNIQFPPEFETGDGVDMRLPNHVFNQLKVHSKVDNKRGHRIHEKKEHATTVCIVWHIRAAFNLQSNEVTKPNDNK